MAIKQLKDKHVLITGAASGIGRSMALAFAKRGANIVASDISHEALESVQKEVEALGVNCLIFVANVGSEEAMKDFADQVHEQVGAIDVLINNAGIGYMGAFVDNDLTHWQRILDINVMGVVYGCHYFLPKMLAGGGAKQIINISSGAGNFPTPGMSAYAASKYAVKGFSETLRMELWNTPVTVTTVHPGVINTAIVKLGANSTNHKVTQAQADTLQAYYQKNGCSPDVVAEDTVKAVISGRQMVNSGPGSSIMYFINRLSPLLARLVSRTAGKKMGYWVESSGS